MKAIEKPRAVLTGASSGLGGALAAQLLENGYEVAMVGRNDAGMRAIVDKLSPEAQARARIVTADLGNLKEVEGLIDRCQSAFGSPSPITHLINNAGFSVTGRIEDIPTEEYERCWRVNFLTPASLCRQVIPEMKKAKVGVISNVGSGVARRALPYVSPYCTAKAALHSFTESLRVELASTGITVMLFSPGPLLSNFHTAQVHCGKTKIISPPFDGKKSEDVAKKFFHAIEQRRERVTLGGRASLAHHLNYWAPRLTDRLLQRIYKLEEA